MELQVSHSVRPKVQTESVFRRKTLRNTRDVTPTMSMERSRNHRGRSMSGPYTYVGEYPAQNERFGIYGVFERIECAVDIPEIREHEVCVPKPRILV